MKKLLAALRLSKRRLVYALVGAAVLVGLFGYHLGNLVGGLSKQEIASATAAVGLNGIYNDPLHLPIKLARSVVFWAEPDHGQLLTRLPNAFFGVLSVLLFAWLMRVWHGPRVALFTTAIFATSAYVLHVNRLASFDAQYLWAVLLLLFIDHVLPRNYRRRLAHFGSLAAWLLLLYIPGMVWLVIAAVYLQRRAIGAGWRRFSAWWQRLGYLLIAFIGLGPLGWHLLRRGGAIEWIGLPSSFGAPLEVLQQLLAVPIHVFVAGPPDSALWLDSVPLLDVFTAAMAVIGIYFYARNRTAHRSRVLGIFLIGGWLLVAVGGAVSMSVVVPLLYIAAGAGIAYLLRQWLQVFPVNPLARAAGIGLVTIAVTASCIYNVRAYFIAWPHNPETKATFIYHR